MTRATIDSRGRITVPLAVRRELGLKPGSCIEFVQVAPHRFELVADTNASLVESVTGKRLGVAKGAFTVPDDIDTPYDAEIERMFNGR